MYGFSGRMSSLSYHFGDCDVKNRPDVRKLHINVAEGSPIGSKGACRYKSAVSVDPRLETKFQFRMSFMMPVHRFPLDEGARLGGSRMRPGHGVVLGGWLSKAASISVFWDRNFSVFVRIFIFLDYQ